MSTLWEEGGRGPGGEEPRERRKSANAAARVEVGQTGPAGSGLSGAAAHVDATTTGLDAEQRRAVEHDPADGPLIVLAGPGTGKTRVITHRIAHLIDDRAVDPASIVAVTFTNKAAAEMRERLRVLIGPKADRVETSTFHALGMRILQRFGDLLEPDALADMPALVAEDLARAQIDTLPVVSRSGGGGGGRPVFGPSLTAGGLLDSAQRKRLLRAIITRLDVLRPLRVHSLDGAADHAREVIDALSERAIFPADALRFAAAWRARLDDPAWAGAPADRRESLPAQRFQQEVFEDACRVYAVFERALRHAGLVTFSDLITLPLRLMRQGSKDGGSAGAAAVLRSQWRHFVVDEFQDVNAAQIELLRELAPPLAGGAGGHGPDLCVVGDDDQSIYAFRGSDERAFAHFAKVWGRAGAAGGVKVVRLGVNYRSTPAIVSLSQNVIERSRSRFAPDKVIRPAAPAAGCAKAGVVWLEDDRQAAQAVGAVVRAGLGDFEGRAPESIAVITRDNSLAAQVAAALRIDGFTVRLSAGGARGDEDAGVQDVLACADLILSPNELWPAVRLLTRPPFSCPHAAVFEAKDALEREESRRSREALGALDPDAPLDPAGREHRAQSLGLLQFIGAPPAGVTINEDLRAAAARLHAMLTELRTFSLTHTGAQTLTRIVELTGVAHVELLAPMERARRVQSVVSLLQLAQQVEPRLDEPRDLRAFIEYFHDLDEEDRRLTPGAGLLGDIEDQIGGDEGRDSALVLSGLLEQGGPGPDATRADGPVIHVLNAHKAKGLEFDCVFVARIGATPGSFGSARRQNAEDHAALPAVLSADGTRLPIERFASPHLAHADGADAPADGDTQREEERRVFYVAATRARRRLWLLSRRLKGASTGTHYVQELVQSDGSRQWLEEVGIGDVLLQAAAAETRERGDDAPPARVVHEPGLDAAISDAFARARREARLLASSALDRADASAPDPASAAERTEHASAAFRESAARLGVVAWVEKMRGPAPAWLIDLAPPGARAGVARLSAELAARFPRAEGVGGAAPGDGAPGGADAWNQMPGVLTPLQLSYTMLDEYLRCPRCYYLRYVAGLTPPETGKEFVGSVVHKALEEFVLDQQRFDAAGEGGTVDPGDLAGVERRLLQRGRALLLGQAARSADGEARTGGAGRLADQDLRESLVRIEMILRNYVRRFHDPGAHVLEVEADVRMPLEFGADECADAVASINKPRRGKGAPPAAPALAGATLGAGHTLRGKMDRLDQITLDDGGAGFRVVDYKTGRDWNKLTSPEPDDLQLGIYALLLGHHLGVNGAGPGGGSVGRSDPTPPSGVRGFAEYWLLAADAGGTAQTDGTASAAPGGGIRGLRGVVALETLDTVKVRRTIARCVAGIRAGRFARGSQCRGHCDLLG